MIGSANCELRLLLLTSYKEKPLGVDQTSGPSFLVQALSGVMLKLHFSGHRHRASIPHRDRLLGTQVIEPKFRR